MIPFKPENDNDSLGLLTHFHPCEKKNHIGIKKKQIKPTKYSPQSIGTNTTACVCVGGLLTNGRVLLKPRVLECGTLVHGVV